MSRVLWFGHEQSIIYGGYVLFSFFSYGRFTLLKLLDIDNIEYYRFAIGKYVLLSLSPGLNILQNEKKSNTMTVMENGKRLKIAVFSQPREKVKNVTVYYQNSVYKKMGNKGKITARTRCFPDGFDEKYDETIKLAFMNPDEFIRKMDDEYLPLFETILTNEKDCSEDYIVYKHYGKDVFNNSTLRRADGRISFVRPTRLNDPFDCNCYFANNSSMDNMFRVFCYTLKNDNILMWSYYSENHEGYCVGYKYLDIIRQISQLNIPGLILLGKVGYKRSRPPMKSNVNHFSYTDFQLYAQACFTKFEDWRHEDERRIVCVSDNYSCLDPNPDFMSVDVGLCKVYAGCNWSSVQIMNSNNQLIPVTQLHKDQTQYKLV